MKTTYVSVLSALLFLTTEIQQNSWRHLSSDRGDLPVPGRSLEQTASLVLDIDKDNTNDFVIGMRREAPALVWFRRLHDGWERYLIEQDLLPIEAGGAFHDIDGDGDLDVVMGEDASGNRVYWWENPCPYFHTGTAWVRRVIKADGANKHHDQIFGDFDGDGKAELVFWNQRARILYLARIPADTRTAERWSPTPIYGWDSGEEHEGLAKGDVDGDGTENIVGGGRWFKRNSHDNFTAHVIDDGQRFTRAAVGQLKDGGPPEVVFVKGDGVGRLKWYECTGDPREPGAWSGHDILEFDVEHGHTLQVADFNGDGRPDILCGEMAQWSHDLVDNPDAHLWIFFGDGRGKFQKTEILTGQGVHEGKVADLDGDGDLDILIKPYRHNTPRIDLLLQR